MAKVTNIKRISKDDFNIEDQELVGRLAFAINPFLEQVTAAFNKGIDFDNLNQDFVFLETEVNETGKPKLNYELKTTIKTRPKAVFCVGANNLTDTTYPSSAPFITYTTNNNIIQILNISGLPANKRFRLSIIIIG